MIPGFAVEQLSAHHGREEFHSGVEALDRYLHAQAGQDVRRRMSTCFVVIERRTGVVAGYYTLAAGSLRLADLPQATTHRLPRYPTIPAARLGRLAVDDHFRAQGLGATLLWNAFARASASEIAAFALLVDAKDGAAVAFYRHHGFTPLSGDPRALFLPLSGVKARTQA